MSGSNRRVYSLRKRPCARRTAIARIALSKTRLVALFGMALSMSAITATAHASIKSSITIDAYSGKILQQYNADATHAPASLTKMMTLYLAFEALSRRRLTWNKRVYVSRHAATRSPSKLYLRTGQRITIRDLVYATAVKSANDAAAALGEAMGGSESRFALMMTRKARQLGMSRTVFRTASGLPASGQRTTARDMARLARALIMHYPQYYRVFSTKYYRVGRRSFGSTNRLLHSHPLVDGMKTGYTRRARYNLVTSAKFRNRRIVTVLLGASSSRERYRRTKAMIAYAWNRSPRRGTMYARVNVPSKSAMRGTRGVARVVAKRAVTPRKTFTRRTVIASTRPTTTQLKNTASNRRKVSLSIGPSRAVASARPARWQPKNTRTAYRTVISRRRVYGVQVGAYRYYRSANRAIYRAAGRLPHAYRRLSRPTIAGYTYRGRRYYRARLMGMSGYQARRACGLLRRRGVACATVSQSVRFATRVRINNRGTVRRVVARPTYRARARAVVTRAAYKPRSRSTRSKFRAKSKRRAYGRYAVQIGTYAKYGWARNSARRMQRALPRSLRGRRTIVSGRRWRGGRIYAARLTGMSRRSAHRACQLLKQRVAVKCIAFRTG